MLADCLWVRYSELNILHSGAVDIPEDQISNVNAIVTKSDRVA